MAAVKKRGMGHRGSPDGFGEITEASTIAPNGSLRFFICKP